MGPRLLACAFVALLPSPAQAYKLQTGISDSCHEIITVEAFQREAARVARTRTLRPPADIELPDSRTWRRLKEKIFAGSDLLPAPGLADELTELVYFSLVVGVRAPDTDGHSISNLNSLRRIHADPSAEGQYAHALRGPDDDGFEGDIAAIEGTQRVIREQLEAAREAIALPAAAQIIEVGFYFDFYGVVPVEVWAPAYHVARAAHAVQDSFSHTIRSGDLTRIRHVLNFVDAISGDLNEERDGVAHSDAMDQCGSETKPIVRAAVDATSALFAATADYLEGTRPGAVTDFFNAWFIYEPGCNASNDYCESEWLPIVRKDATGPYLGCASGAGLTLVLLVALLWPWRRRWGLGLVFVGAFGVTDVRAADWPLQVEGHLSTLSDAPNRSVLASTFGYGLRGGWRSGDIGVFAHIERNYWVATDLDTEVFGGVLNVGIGAEYLFAEGFLRTSGSFGGSILMEDTPLHDAGETREETGFLDLRPVEFRWPLRPSLFLNLTPLGLTLVTPVREEPRLSMIQYRTTLAVEYVL